MKKFLVAFLSIICATFTSSYTFRSLAVAPVAGSMPSQVVYYNTAEILSNVVPEDIIEIREIPEDIIPLSDAELQMVELKQASDEKSPDDAVIEEVSASSEPEDEIVEVFEPNFIHPEIDTDPESVTVLVNHHYSLPSDYVPSDLVSVKVKFNCSENEDKRLMRAEAAVALEDMFNAALDAGIELCAISGYRSYDRQYHLYHNNVRVNGEQFANRYSAPEGQSEHQTGLAMDISSVSNGYSLDYEFISRPEGKWLTENCSDFGFIIRYPEDKEDVTGYAYEPWHIRYVGTRLAEYLTMNDITLDEYYGVTAEGDLGYAD